MDATTTSGDEHAQVLDAGGPGADDPETIRRSRRRRYRVARRRLEAAELLFSCQFRAEAIRLAAVALEALWAERTVRGPGRDPSDPAIEGALAELRGAPEEDVLLGDEHERAFRRAIGFAHRLAVEIDAATESPTAARRRTFLRRLGAVVTALALVAAALVGIRHLRAIRLTATASAQWANDVRYPPSNLVDANPGSEWLGNDGAMDWVEITPSRRVHVRAVRILNGRNAPFMDRAMHDFRVEFRRDGRVVSTSDSGFMYFSEHPRWLELSVGVPDVDAVRIVTKSFFGRGPGLAEVELVTR